MKPAPSSDYVPALGFHWLTPYYDAVVGTTTRERAFKRALIAQAGIAPGHRVLDLASGTGTLTIWLKQHAPDAEVTGVDGDPTILKIAQRKAQQAKVAVTNASGRLVNLFEDAGFTQVRQRQSFSTIYGTMALYSAIKPG